MLRLAEKAFWPARIPFPVMHVDTGHNFDEVLDYRDRRVAELGIQLVVASVQASIDAGRVVEETGPARQPQPPADRHAPRRHHRARVRRGVRRRAARRGEGAGEGARVLVPRRLRPVGPEEPASRAVEPLQRSPPQGRAHPRLPVVELDRARHLAVRRHRRRRAAVDLLRAPARGVPPRRDVARGVAVRHAHGRRRADGDDGALPHRRRRVVHRRGRVLARSRSTT